MIFDGVCIITDVNSSAILNTPLLPTCIEQPEGGLFSVAFFYFRLVVCKIFGRLNKEQWRTVRHYSFGWQSRHDIAGDLDDGPALPDVREERCPSLVRLSCRSHSLGHCRERKSPHRHSATCPPRGY